MSTLREALGGSIAQMLGNAPAQAAAGDHGWTEGFATLADLIFDPALQMRVDQFDQEYIEELREVIRAGEDLGRIQIHIVDGRWYITDGWQRTKAYEREDYTHVPARWKVASWGDALDAAFLANGKHGKRLNDADKWHKLQVAVERWRGDLEGSFDEETGAKVGEMSQTDFARRTGLTVSYVHRHLPTLVTLPDYVYVTRNGRRFVQATANIGRATKAEEPAQERTNGLPATYVPSTNGTGSHSAHSAGSGGSGGGSGGSGATYQRQGRATDFMVTIHLPAEHVEEFKEFVRDWEGADELRNIVLSQL